MTEIRQPQPGASKMHKSITTRNVTRHDGSLCAAVDVMPGNVGLNSSSRNAQQDYEDGLARGPLEPRGVSVAAQQQEEDKKRMPFWRKPNNSRRNSIHLENGAPAAPAAAHLQTRRGIGDPIANAANRAANLRAERRSDGIPLSRLASYLLPPAGTSLRIMNDPEDSDHDDGSETAAANFNEADNNQTVRAVRNDERWNFPELSEYSRQDDPASQTRRRENLLRASQRVAKSAKENLFYPIKERTDRSKVKKYVLNVATMQAAAIRYYQTMIVEYGAEMYRGGVYDEMPEILHKYCELMPWPTVESAWWTC